MKKFIFKTIIGVFITLISIALAYFHFDGGGDTVGPWLLIVSVVLLPVGLFFLSRVVASGNAIYNLATEAELEASSKETIKPHVPDDKFQGMLDKNNAMVQDYAKTSKTRDQLKVLEIAGAAEEQSSK